MKEASLRHRGNILKFIFLSFLFVQQSWAQKITLEQYMEEVNQANPNIEASRLRALSLEHKIAPSKTLEDPFIAAGIDEVPFKGGSAGLRRYQLSQSIPFPGKLSTRGEIAEKKAETGKFDSETLGRQIKVVATQVYLRASFNQESMKLNQKIQAILEEITSSAKSRYRTGENLHHEWLIAKLELSSLKVDLLRLQRTDVTLKALLNELRNKPPGTPIDVSDLAVNDVQEDLKPDLSNQPEIKTLQAYKLSSEKELKLAKLGYAPDFVIQGMAMEPTSRNMSQQGSNWGVMVGITVPLYFWRKQSELVTAAEKSRTATLLEMKGLENRLNTEVTDALQQYKTAFDVVKLYKNEVIPVTEIAVKNARASYAAKTAPLSQLLEALKTQRIQELEYLASKIDVSIAKLRVTELLSNPPLLRFAPTRPTMFGTDMTSSMGLAGEMGGSATINMGSGMSGPTRKESTPESNASGMPGGM